MLEEDKTVCVRLFFLLPPDTVAGVTRKLGVTAGGEGEEDEPSGEATVSLHCPVAGAHWVAIRRPNSGGSLRPGGGDLTFRIEK